MVAGISSAGPEDNAQFRSKLGLQSALLSDSDGKIRQAYDSMRRLGTFRAAYLIDKGGVIRGAHEYRVLGIGKHVKKLLRGLEAMREAPEG